MPNWHLLLARNWAGKGTRGRCGGMTRGLLSKIYTLS
jgi:hypothetical protein